MSKIVIVGGGAAGHKALQRVVEISPSAEVTIISSENTLAYERPMLSKECLVDDVEPRYLALNGELGNVRQLLGKTAEQIDRTGKQLVLAGGERVPYDKLILATGSRPRRLLLEGSDTTDVHYLRVYSDATAIRGQLKSGKRLVVIGGGFIGLEVAAAARKRGAQVVVLEAQPRLLARVAPTSISHFLTQLHSKNGVQIETGVFVSAISQNASGETLIHTSEGVFHGDVVVAGIGILPNVELAQHAGLDVDNGIVVDERCRTSDSDIFAAGEVTRHPVSNLGMSARMECWTSASEQGAVAGENAAGLGNKEYRDMPWLWSDQYDCSIQYLGLPLQAKTLIRHSGGSPDSWVDIGLSASGAFLGAIGVNANRQIAELRRALRKGSALPSQYVPSLHPA